MSDIIAFDGLDLDFHGLQAVDWIEDTDGADR